MMGGRSPLKSDVAIVGAGPAGARAAYALARRGARVVVFDASHPREKPCGGGITGRALSLVGDALRVHDLEAVAITSARFRRRPVAGGAPHGGDEKSRVPLDDGMLMVSSRAHFDASLLGAAIRAGAHHERVRVKDVALARDGVTIVTARGSRRADFVIGADGPTSVVRRRLARPFRRDQLSIATGFFAHGTAGSEIELELLSDPPGYIWSFPRTDHLAVGVCAQADSGVSARALRLVTAAWMNEADVARGARLIPYSWPIPSLNARDFATLELCGSRWCLAGDAAGLVDPITREGIYFALASGQWAADALANERVNDYSRRVRDEAVSELARAARLKEGFFRPHFTSLVVAALQESAPIRRVMADLIAGRQPYATLKWRLLKTLEFGLAWKAVAAWERSHHGGQEEESCLF
jgi:geranylgeranyl reductase family protein